MDKSSKHASQCTDCIHGNVVMSGPHEGSGIYVKCNRPRRAVTVHGGDIKCDAFVAKEDIKNNS